MKKQIFLALLALGVSTFSAVDMRGETPGGDTSKKLIGIDDKILSLSPEEAEAMTFLYKSMPISDKAMWSPEYHLNNVRMSLKAKEEMPWGKNVPEDLWRHFVLPSRVNNEYLDNFRSAYYDELKDRVKGMSMYDAVLEVNHWLHEKVTYQPSDSRTSAPMATIKTAKGRCGEESVLGVAAFRTLGIPSRQVYTPRWAHTDDNHAWVEVWVDGKWYFLGACEPESELNRAWFNAPVSRGMIMHTRVFGDYSGPEQIIFKNKGTTEINVTENYVPVRESKVKVVDINGATIPNIDVEYRLYNYSEFYPTCIVQANDAGEATLKTGFGDMIAWASNGDKFGFAKIDSPETTLILDKTIGERYSFDIDIVPPAENPIPSHATEEQIRENQRRFELENSIRDNYTASFFGEKLCTKDKKDVIKQFGNDDADEICILLQKAKGNWREIWDAIAATNIDRRQEMIKMLNTVSEKDLRDTRASIFLNTLVSTEPLNDNPLYIDYILNPRISNEILTDYRLKMHSAGTERKYSANEIFNYTLNNITLDNEANGYRVPITPMEVWKTKKADAHSRDIFFVAACRNSGIPARINLTDGRCQYHDGDNWVTVNFSQANSVAEPTGKLITHYNPDGYMKNPQYYRHYSLSKFKNGSPKQLDAELDEWEDYQSMLANEKPVELAEGYYMLTTGNRLASGSVLAHVEFFPIKRDSVIEIPFIMRHNDEEVSVIGSVDAEKTYMPDGSDAPSSILSTTGRGYFVIALLGDTDEPSNHAAVELEALAPTLNEWGRPVILIGRERKELSKIKNLHIGKDINKQIDSMLRSCLDTPLPDNSMPIVIIADTFGRVVFLSHGYDTSLSQKMSSVIPQL